jgi:predicted nucleotidyltransferase component of viral defense system
MDQAIRNTQLKILSIFAQTAKTFALCGGTALELFYLKHRFSRDLDFFSCKYNLKEINKLVLSFNKIMKSSFKLENEFIAPNRAQVRFYTTKIQGTDAPLKIDFVEDVFFEKPIVKKFDSVPVYDVKNIYFQKIIALIGSSLTVDDIGREIPSGRNAVRDIFDIYFLSKKIEPLHDFIRTLNRQYQRGIIQWYRSYSRQDVKLDVFDLDIYDKNFDASDMIRYLDAEIKLFINEAVA